MNPNIKIAIFTLGILILLLVYFEKSKRLAYFVYKNLTTDHCDFKPRKIEYKICPENGIVTVLAGGRLGNKIWEYASVWGISLQTGLKPFVPSCIRDELDQIFDHLSIPTLEQIEHCKIKMDDFVNSTKIWKSDNQSILLPRYFTGVQPILEIQGEFKRVFQFNKNLYESSQSILRNASKDFKNPIFIGTHARRNDYLLYLHNSYKILPADDMFFKLAMELMNAKYRNSIFILVSDSLEWLKKFDFPQKRIFKHYSKDPGLDLAVLASCNHSIFDYGTYGATAAILAGGDAYFYDFNQSFARRIGLFVSNWTGVII